MSTNSGLKLCIGNFIRAPEFVHAGTATSAAQYSFSSYLGFAGVTPAARVSVPETSDLSIIIALAVAAFGGWYYWKVSQRMSSAPVSALLPRKPFFWRTCRTSTECATSGSLRHLQTLASLRCRIF